MKSQTDYLTITYPSRMGFVNITADVQECLRKSGVREGLCLVSSMHITSSVFISVDEPGLLEDFQALAGAAGAVRPLAGALPPQPHRRGQRRRPPEAADPRPASGVGDHEGPARLRPVGTHLLRRVRRQSAEARAGEDHRRVKRVLVSRRPEGEPRGTTRSPWLCNDLGTCNEIRRTATIFRIGGRSDRSEHGVAVDRPFRS